MKNKYLFILCLLAQPLFGQIEKQQIYIEEEKIDDPYIAVPETDRVRSTAYSFSSTEITTIQVNVDSDGNNLVGDAANEPSLAIDPTDPSRIAIGWRQFETIESNFRQAGIAVSIDAGATWFSLEPIESAIFRSDPVLDTDSEGNFYYNSLTEDFSCDVFKTDDLSIWEDKTDAIGGDKQWMVIDKTNQNSNGHIYAFWKQQFSACSDGSFTRSVDQGMTYEECETVPQNPTRGTLAIGPDGTLYACGGWNGTFRVLKSATAKDPNAVVDWELNTVVDLKGSQALYAGPNPSGMLGQVWIAVDHSDTPTNGYVYLLSSVTRFDNNDPADMMFSRSEDGGNTWSEAIRINTDNSTSNWQWFGSMSVAPNGRIDVTWMDTRDNPNTVLSALYYSSSDDGGLTWTENEKLSEAFDPHLGWPNQQKIGDYNHMISDDEAAYLAWAATFNGEQDIYYSIITAPEILSNSYQPEKEPITRLSIQAFPNPMKEETTIHFYTDNNTNLTIKLLDVMGQTVQQLADNQFSKGQHQLNWHSNNKNGIYFLQVENEMGERNICKIVLY